MPIHDWSRVEAGIFHHFHQAWTIEISDALNGGGLPPDYFAMAEQIVSGPIPDVVTLQRRRQSRPAPPGGGVVVTETPPQARFVMSAPVDRYGDKANRILIKHSLGHVVAVIEIVSPGNKNSINAIRSFVDKAERLIRQGVNLLVVDLFPPSVRNPQGLHREIWSQFEEEPFELPSDKPLTIAAYAAAEPCTAYVEPVAVGDALPGLPIFLDAERYVPAPLEKTYQSTWDKCPDAIQEVVLSPQSP
jgi:hypothetical protein